MTRSKIIAIAFLSAFIFCLCSCKDKKTRYEVKGKLDNVASDMFYAAREIGDSLFVDTIKIDKDGKFSFEGNIDSLTVISLYFNQNTKSTYILVDKNWKVNIKGDVNYPDQIIAKGGQINDDLSAFKEEHKSLLRDRAELLNAPSSKSVVDTLVGKDLAELKNLNFELSNLAAKYVRKNPTKIASAMLINTFFRDESTIPRLDENLRILQGEAQDFPLTQSMRRYSEKVKASSVGVKAPSFTLKDVDGNKVSLQEYKGKHTLLTFVATTCDVCNIERKISVEVYDRLKKEKVDIEFLTIVLDSEIKPISETAKDSIKWKLLTDDGGWAAKTVEQYNIHEIPYSILISPEGDIIERNISLYTFPKKFKDLIEKK